MANTIYRDFCPDCGGTGHLPGCRCKNGVDFIVGCCERCGGEGFISVDGPDVRAVNPFNGVLPSLIAAPAFPAPAGAGERTVGRC